MSHDTGDKNGQIASTRTMDIIVAFLLMLVAAIVMEDSWRSGASWSQFGPETGYFPFRVGAILFVSSAAILLTNLFTRSPNLDSFVTKTQLKAVMQVLIPTAVFVFAIDYIGVYEAGALFIAFFMYWLGKYPIYKIVPISILIPFALFVLFEVWFLVPMPKGPIENALGF
jgi:hypothetical protein